MEISQSQWCLRWNANILGAPRFDRRSKPIIRGKWYTISRNNGHCFTQGIYCWVDRNHTGRWSRLRKQRYNGKEFNKVTGHLNTQNNETPMHYLKSRKLTNFRSIKWFLEHWQIEMDAFRKVIECYQSMADQPKVWHIEKRSVFWRYDVMWYVYINIKFDRSIETNFIFKFNI